MFRNRYLLPLGLCLLAMLPMLREAQGGVWAPLTDEVNFQCDNGITAQGYSVYVVGNHPKLGDWDPAKAVKLSPVAYPTWTGRVEFPSADDGKEVEWKCIVRNETILTDVQKWQGNPNNIVKLAFRTTSIGRF